MNIGYQTHASFAPQASACPHHSTTPTLSKTHLIVIIIIIIIIINTTYDDISPSLHNRINLINTNTLSDENLMKARLGRNM